MGPLNLYDTLICVYWAINQMGMYWIMNKKDSLLCMYVGKNYKHRIYKCNNSCHSEFYLLCIVLEHLQQSMHSQNIENILHYSCSICSCSWSSSLAISRNLFLLMNNSPSSLMGYCSFFKSFFFYYNNLVMNKKMLENM